MDIRPITDTYAVSPQIAPEDMEAIREAGFTTIICNRPDAEVPPALQSDAVGEAARAAGLRYEVLPLTHQTMTPENVSKQASFVASSEGPVLAYCASGTRSSVVWALGQAGTLSTEEILGATARAGYDLGGLRPALDAAQRG